MARLSIPYDRGYLQVELPDSRIAAVLTPAAVTKSRPPDVLIKEALQNPLASPPLAELSRGKRRVVVITSDHTRPLPSRITLPPLLDEIRRGNGEAEITILVGTGTHRPSTPQELAEKFGSDIVGREKIVCHRGDGSQAMVEIGRLPSGVPLEINKLAMEADLLAAEGFIEPHFFAGFSGGPKSVLPGIASNRTIRANHSGPNIGHDKARTGVLAGNPIRAEMEAAADLAGLAFIHNVVLDREGNVTAAFAGEWRRVHAQGAAFLAAHARVQTVQAAITLTSNGGYPLDQNLYQAVKGMTAAEATTIPGGRIVIAAACLDGLGGEGFASLLAGMSSPAEFYALAAKTPPGETVPDLWEAQILARILAKYRVTLVSDHILPDTKLPPGLSIRTSLPEALAEALAEAGPEAKVVVIPDGVAVIPVVGRSNRS